MAGLPKETHPLVCPAFFVGKDIYETPKGGGDDGKGLLLQE